MQLTPRYGDEPVLVLPIDAEPLAEATIRQRRRFASTLEQLTAEDWAHPSRCDGWSTRDVVVHLDGTNGFWTLSIRSGLNGDPTRFLATFDPVASPPEMVAAKGEPSPDAVIESFHRSTDELESTIESLGGDDWNVLAEAPPGHISVAAVVHHALWDSWVHERDVLLPLGRECAVEDDEVAACLRYAAALGPTLYATQGSANRGRLRVEATDPDVAFVVAAGDRVEVQPADTAVADATVRGDAVDLVEAFSVRRPFDADVDESAAWLLGGVRTVFDVDAP